jgi:hypothetical protein
MAIYLTDYNVRVATFVTGVNEAEAQEIVDKANLFEML